MDTEKEVSTMSKANNLLAQYIEKLKRGKISVKAFQKFVARDATTSLGHTIIDNLRLQRTGAAEVIYGAGKTDGQIIEIAKSMAERGNRVLATRLSESAMNSIKDAFQDVQICKIAKMAAIGGKIKPKSKTKIAIVSAGTSDMPVAEEARFTAEFLGSRTQSFYDCGVAGLSRLLDRLEEISEARVIIAVAGMEGALATVLAGLVDKPLIAVPTSVGYGASFKGVAALLAMMNSCANGVSVVNIDNGFGAGYNAHLINTITER